MNAALMSSVCEVVSEIFIAVSSGSIAQTHFTIWMTWYSNWSEDCEDWWLSGCRSSVAEHWLHKPGRCLGFDSWRLLAFSLFSPNLSLFQHEARVLSVQYTVSQVTGNCLTWRFCSHMLMLSIPSSPSSTFHTSTKRARFVRKHWWVK